MSFLTRCGEWILERLCALVFFSLYKTYRVKQKGFNFRDEATSFHPQEASLMALWHEHIFLVAMGQRGYPSIGLISKSIHGKILAFGLKTMSISAIFGSGNRDGKDKGGLAARRQILESFKEGHTVLTAVDGSIGPRRFVKPGTIELSRTGQVLIVPIGAAARRYWELNSWDRFKIPKPFTDITIVYGKPMAVPHVTKHREFLAFQEELAKKLNDAEKEAQKLLLKKDRRSLHKNPHKDIKEQGGV